MSGLILSPTLHAICHGGSRSYRSRYSYGRLNVCNVVRSLVYVLLKRAIQAFAATAVLNAMAQVIFVMIVAHLWNPFDALDVIVLSGVPAKDFNYLSFAHWFNVSGIVLGGIFSLLLWIAAGVTPIGLIGFAIAMMHEAGWLKKPGRVAVQTLETVVDPVSIFFEYVASKHNKFCVNIQSTVNIKKTYADRLREAMHKDVEDHYYAVKRMTIPQLLASIEHNRSILLKHAKGA